MYKNLQIACDFINKKTKNFTPQVALVLGSGLGDMVSCVDKVCEINYKDIKGFPVSTVAGHSGKFIFGHLKGVPIVVMQGRVHYYEGYSMPEVVMPIRIMKMLGAEVLFLTNSAGGINENYGAGNLMAVLDHINFAPNPLIGKNIDELGVRFPDMTNCYNDKLIDIINDVAREINIELKNGVYAQLTGPSYETPAEIKMLRKLGADAVGMSTACEAIAGNHAKMKVCAVSCISNMASGITGEKLSHEEVVENGKKVKAEFIALITNAIVQIGMMM